MKRQGGTSFSDRFFVMLARLVVGGRSFVLLASAVLTGLAIYASTSIVINTSTEGIFSSKVEFIRNARAYFYDLNAKMNVKAGENDS
jgi:hypothetical protein